jgi:hypothetical protein
MEGVNSSMIHFKNLFVNDTMYLQRNNNTKENIKIEKNKPKTKILGWCSGSNGRLSCLASIST